MNFKHIQFSMLALGAVALASCSESEEAMTPAAGDNSISFSTYVGDPASRAASWDIQALQNLEQGFGVYASWDQGLDWANGSQSMNFMKNQQVQYSGGQWTYSPLKYWPGSNEKVSFMAYAPYVGEYLNPFSGISRLYSVQESGDNGPRLWYTLGSDITQQEDLLYATSFDKSNTSGPIQFQFKHALSKIGFKVTGWSTPAAEATTTVTINGISLSTMYEKAYFILQEETWDNPFIGDKTKSFIVKEDLLQNNVFTDADGQSGRLNTDDGFILTIPTISSNISYCIMVDYTIETKDENLEGGKVTTRNKVYRYAKPMFEQGKSYIVNIHLGLDGSVSEGGDIPGTPGDDIPLPVDPNPEDSTTPSGPGTSTTIQFSATVGSWDGEDTGVNVPF